MSKTTSSKLVKSLVGQSNTLTIPVAFIKACDGDHLQALLLSQIIYWSSRSTTGDGWFAKSYSDWNDELCMSQYQVSRAVKKLKVHKLIATKLKKSRYYDHQPTLHYWCDIEKIAVFVTSGYEETSHPEYQETKQPEYQETKQPMETETTSETTSKKKDNTIASDDLKTQADAPDNLPAYMTKPVDELTEHQSWLKGIVRLTGTDASNYALLGKYKKFLHGEITDKRGAWYDNQPQIPVTISELRALVAYVGDMDDVTALKKPATIAKHLGEFRYKRGYAGDMPDHMRTSAPDKQDSATSTDTGGFEELMARIGGIRIAGAVGKDGKQQYIEIGVNRNADE